MKNNVLIKSLILGLLALALSAYFINQNKGVTEFEQRALLPNFDVSAVKRITMKTANKGQLVDAEKTPTQWQLANKFGYPANVTKLSTLLQSLKNAKIVELKTQQEKYFSRLGLQDISKENSQATLLTLSTELTLIAESDTEAVLNSDKKPGNNPKSKTVQLLLGKKSSAEKGRYIRFVGDKQTYLVDLDIDLPDDDAKFLAPNIVPFEFDKVRKMEVDVLGDTFSVIRKKIKQEQGAVKTNDKALDSVLGDPAAKPTFILADNFELETKLNGKNKDKKPQYASIFSGLVRNVVNLTVQDVKLAEQNTMGVYQSIVISYIDDNLISDENFQGNDAEATQDNESRQLNQSSELSQMNQLTLTLYKNGRKDSDYWLRVDDQRWLLKISEFDFKQVSKPLYSYFE